MEQNEIIKEQENSSEERRKKIIKLSIIGLLIFLLAAASTVVLVEVLNNYANKSNSPTINIPLDEGSSSGIGAESGEDNDGGEDEFVANPSFHVSDKDQIWTSETKVDIFNCYYFNDEGELTVDGNAHNVIAPGTANNYTFKCKNNGNVAIDYVVSFEVYYSDGFDHIPVQAVLTDSTGINHTKAENGWVSIEWLDGFSDTRTLGANSYINYTLSWEWLFEGDDHYDTALGDIAVTDDLNLTVVIKTIATENPDPNAQGGHVDTGDASNFALWLGALLISFMVLILLVAFAPKKKKERD